MNTTIVAERLHNDHNNHYTNGGKLYACDSANIQCERSVTNFEKTVDDGAEYSLLILIIKPYQPIINYKFQFRNPNA